MNPYLELILLIVGTITILATIVVFVLWGVLPFLAWLVKMVLGE